MEEEDAQEKIWVKPVLVGVAAAILWKPLTGSSLGGALVAGIAATGIAHLVLSRIGGRKAEPDRPASHPSAASAPEPASQPAGAAAPVVRPSKALPGEAELAARKGTWRYSPGPA